VYANGLMMTEHTFYHLRLWDYMYIRRYLMKPTEC